VHPISHRDEKGGFIRESFKFSLYKVHLVYADAFLEVATKTSNYEIRHILYGDSSQLFSRRAFQNGICKQFTV